MNNAGGRTPRDELNFGYQPVHDKSGILICRVHRGGREALVHGIAHKNWSRSFNECFLKRVFVGGAGAHEGRLINRIDLDSLWWMKGHSTCITYRIQLILSLIHI